MEKKDIITGYKEMRAKHEKEIPVLTEKWCKEAIGIIDDKFLDEWNKAVPIRLSDMYMGMELGSTLELIPYLNKEEKDYNGFCKTIATQNHSGMSFGLVCHMVNAFTDGNEEFIESLLKGEIDVYKYV